MFCSFSLSEEDEALWAAALFLSHFPSSASDSELSDEEEEDEDDEDEDEELELLLIFPFLPSFAPFPFTAASFPIGCSVGWAGLRARGVWLLWVPLCVSLLSGRQVAGDLDRAGSA